MLALARALLDFLIFFGTFSDFGDFVDDSETTLLVMEAAWLIKKLVDCSRIDVEDGDEEEYQRLLISGSNLVKISSYSLIPS